MPYAIEFQRRVYTPDGKVDDAMLNLANVDEYNAAVEAAELAEWAKQPDRWQVYITKTESGYWHATTWRGVSLGALISRKSFRTNLSRNMVAVTFRGTNGATYYGRYGADWSQLCRVRKSKES